MSITFQQLSKTIADMLQPHTHWINTETGEVGIIPIKPVSNPTDPSFGTSGPWYEGCRRYGMSKVRKSLVIQPEQKEKKMYQFIQVSSGFNQMGGSVPTIYRFAPETGQTWVLSHGQWVTIHDLQPNPSGGCGSGPVGRQGISGEAYGYSSGGVGSTR